MSTCWTITLLIFGALLELGAIVVLALDVYDRTSRDVSDPLGLVKEYGRWYARIVGVAGSVRRAFIPVGLFAAGLLLQTIASVVSVL